MTIAAHPKRSQSAEETEPPLTTAKRARFSLDSWDEFDIFNQTGITNNGDWDQTLEPINFPTQNIGQSNYFDTYLEDIERPVLELPRWDADLDYAKNPLCPGQSVVIQNENSTEVCYGALSKVQAILLPSAVTVSDGAFIKDQSEFQQFTVLPHNDYHVLLSPNSGMFARLDNVTSAALQNLSNFSNCRAVAVVKPKILQQTNQAGKSNGIFCLSINIFGPEAEGDIIGERLANASAFLQHPCFLEDGYEYYNPQYYYPDNKKKPLTHLIGLTESDIRAKRLSDEVEQVLASLEDTSTFNNDTANDLLLNGIVTPLKMHQKSALNFIRHRENHHECQSVARDLHQLIKLSAIDKVPSFAMGGILADVMGLGKTLSMLSAIISSRSTSWSYQEATENEVGACIISPMALRSRATLIIVTSIQVLDVWKREITTHIPGGDLTFMVFHGEKRPKLPQNLIEHDLVLTTYATLVSDSKASKVLQKIAWFRVVLDEAHWIRNQTSQQFRASEKLISQRRWCLTGTPIQNRLHDLLSLLKFLHFEPFCRPSVFQQHILNPLKMEDSDRVKMLHVLLRGMCLRRNEKYLEMPSPCCKG